MSIKSQFKGDETVKDKEIIIIYRKSEIKEHLTVQQKDHRLVRQFIRETRKKESERG